MNELNILVDIEHPAHVHFFKNPIRIWEQDGHKIHVVTRDKDITHQLLNELGIYYTSLSRQQVGLFRMMIELLVRWWKIFFIIKKRRIDVAISIGGISTSFPAFLAGIVSITDTDTEDAGLSNAIAFRFSDIVLTPSSFLKKEKVRNLKTYDSFHELAYLHPNRFSPDIKNLRTFGIREGDRYVLIRLVKWRALHDIHEQGISEDNLRNLIRLIRNKGCHVFISAERKISQDFEPYIIKGELNKIMDVMAFSYGYIGESPTMAMETALLGRPSVFISSRVNNLGYVIELQQKYGLLKNFIKYENALPFVERYFFTDAYCSGIIDARQRLLQDKIDISAWIAQFTVDYTVRQSGGKKK